MHGREQREAQASDIQASNSRERSAQRDAQELAARGAEGGLMDHSQADLRALQAQIANLTRLSQAALAQSAQQAARPIAPAIQSPEPFTDLYLPAWQGEGHVDLGELNSTLDMLSSDLNSLYRHHHQQALGGRLQIAEPEPGPEVPSARIPRGALPQRSQPPRWQAPSRVLGTQPDPVGWAKGAKEPYYQPNGAYSLKAEDLEDLSSVEAAVASGLAECTHLASIVAHGGDDEELLQQGSLPAGAVGALGNGAPPLPYYPQAGWGWEGGRFMTRSEEIMDAVYRDAQRQPGYYGTRDAAAADKNPPTLHHEAPRRVDEWWYNDTGVRPEHTSDRAHPMDTFAPGPRGRAPGGLGYEEQSLRAYQEREITIDDLLGSQLDDMADSVNLASKRRLERALTQITHGNPPSSVSLRGGEAGAARPAPRRADPAAPGAAHQGQGGFVDPLTCGLLLSMESAGPGGKEEARFAFSLRQELAAAAGAPMERFQYCGSSWGAAAASFAPAVFVPHPPPGRDPHTGPYNLYPSSFSSATRTDLGWQPPGKRRREAGWESGW